MTDSELLDFLQVKQTTGRGLAYLRANYPVQDGYSRHFAPRGLRFRPHSTS